MFAFDSADNHWVCTDNDRGSCGPGGRRSQWVRVEGRDRTRWWLSNDGAGVVTLYHRKDDPLPPGKSPAVDIAAPGATTGGSPAGGIVDDHSVEWISVSDDARQRGSAGRAAIAAGRPAGSWLQGLEVFPLPHVKRAFDLVVSLLVLVAVAPLLLALALAIVVDSWGSPIFVQERIGIGGRRFRMLKFRTMLPDAESRLADVVHLNERNGPLFKIRDDPRQTRLGRLLRVTSLDELPQLLNIIRGDMSLVGPRPPLPREVASYGPVEMRRLSVTPGLTGAWQVSRRSELIWEAAVRLDLDYIDNWSFRRDLMLMLKTFVAVVCLRNPQ